LFFKEIDKIAKIVKALLKEKNVKIVSHYDADGLTSAAIMIKALTREGANFKLHAIKQLTEAEITRLDATEDDFLIFLDLGSGQIDGLRNLLEKTQILILDHHDPIRKDHMNLLHINPLVLGEEEISGAMVAYLFAKALNPRNTDLVDLAVVGAIGDVMDNNWKLEGLGRRILEEAEMLGKVTINQGLRLYGRNTRPVFKSIEYSSDITIPGITGSESNAVQFLSEIGIELKEGGKWRMLKDLTEEEQKKLASAIIVERLNHGLDEAEDIFGEIYTLVGRPEELQDVREFSTLINACGRTGRFEVAIRLCLGDLTAIKDSWDIVGEYKRLISNGMRWLRDGNMDERESVVVIDGGSRIDDAIIGTLSSISLSSGLVDTEKIIVGLADAGSGKLKVSARMSRHLSFNLRDIIVESAEAVDGEAGGHQFAAGGMIDADKKEEFIKAVENQLSKLKKM
jgi:RecJ-like exonuclease